ncbi:MAG: hypothetical protein RBR15_01565 [Sphaerochaeta sp.]|nr:hypothetical protein [Sphaerochaeta sp.]
MRHTKTKILIPLLVLLTITTLSLTARDMEFNGMLRDHIAYTFEDSEFAVHEQTLDLTLAGWGENTSIVVNPTIYMGDNQKLELGIREAYVDFYLEDADIRIGKQAIIWGEAEGAFITDLVSPRDMRSFILADFKEIRKGVPAIKVDYYKDAFTFEGIWVAKFIPTSMPDQSSMWAKQPGLPGANPAFLANAEFKLAMPEQTLHNSELFGKVSHFGSKANWALMGGYAFTDEPYISKVTPAASPAKTIIDQEHGRYIMGGGSLSTSVGPTVLRLEAAAYFNKPFTSMPSGPASAAVEKHHQVQSLAGLDWSMWGTQMSTQYILGFVHDHHDNLVDQGKLLKEVSHTFTFRVQKSFFADRLAAKLFTYVEADPLNALIRGSLAWTIEDGVVLEGGLDLFTGDSEGTFGSYKDNSLAWMALRWYF